MPRFLTSARLRAWGLLLVKTANYILLLVTRVVELRAAFSVLAGAWALA